MAKDFNERLADWIDGHPVCDEQVAADLGRICRRGFTSAEGILEVLEIVEAGRQRVDQSMRGMEWSADDYGVVVPFPGQIGGVAVATSLEWE